MARLVQLLRAKAGNATGVLRTHAHQIPQSTVLASQEKEEEGGRSRGLKKFRGLFKELQDVKEKRCIFFYFLLSLKNNFQSRIFFCVSKVSKILSKINLRVNYKYKKFIYATCLVHFYSMRFL